MSWEQFHFKCRFFLQKVSKGLTIQEAGKCFEKSDVKSLYSAKDLIGIQKELFDKIFYLSSITDAERALKVFSSINIAKSLASSKTFKSITNKLAYLESITAIFVVFITIYKLYVYPVFYGLIQQYPGLGNELFALVPSMWLMGLTLALLTFMFTFSYRKYIKNIDILVINKPSSSMKFFIPKHVMAEISTLNKIVMAPLNKNRSDDYFCKKMATLAEMGLDESVELTSLFSYHSEKLEFAIWQHSKRMFGFMYVLVTSAIAFYIMQIYEPLFKLGAII